MQLISNFVPKFTCNDLSCEGRSSVYVLGRRSLQELQVVRAFASGSPHPADEV